MIIGQDAVVGTLIAGPSRCGKSTLAAALLEGKDGPAVLTVEALFPAFRSITVRRSREARAQFVRDYLRRPRFMDPARSVVRCPADDIGDGLDAIIEGVAKKEVVAPVSLISAALDAWAVNIGKSSWIAPDLHAEIYFTQFVQVVPNLQMIVLLRDPREALAASLYWRTYPERMAGGKRMMLHKLLLWCLSADIGHRLARTMSDRVCVVFVESLLNPEDRSPRRLFPGLAIPPPPAGNDRSPYFTYLAGKGWLGPDGCWKPLLSAHELYVIERVCRPWVSAKRESADCGIADTVGALGTRAMLWIVLMLARLSPGLAKSLMEFALFPISSSYNVLLDFARAFRGTPRSS